MGSIGKGRPFLTSGNECAALGDGPGVVGEVEVLGGGQRHWSGFEPRQHQCA